MSPCTEWHILGAPPTPTLSAEVLVDSGLLLLPQSVFWCSLSETCISSISCYMCGSISSDFTPVLARDHAGLKLAQKLR